MNNLRRNMSPTDWAEFDAGVNMPVQVDNIWLQDPPMGQQEHNQGALFRLYSLADTSRVIEYHVETNMYNRYCAALNILAINRMASGIPDSMIGTFWGMSGEDENRIMTMEEFFYNYGVTI
jgi:hypothetical protein